MSLKKAILITTMILGRLCLQAQDPHFSQFFASPLTINPAMTGVINGQWRLVSNWRQQWIGPGNPYSTATVCYDAKIMKNRIPENNVIGAGGMLMYDRTMGGALNSIYASADFSYHMALDENYTHWLGAGFSLLYGNRTIDYSALTFAEQFTGTGFNTSLPTGETALSNIKPYFSIGAGALYGYHTDAMNFNAGVAAYHLNKPKQTALKDDTQVLPARYVAHYDFDAYLSSSLLLYSSGVYQTQAGSEYIDVGMALGYEMNDGINNTIFSAGMWYRNQDCVAPYVGLSYNNMQFGFTYDVTVSQLSKAPKPPKSWEFSFIIRNWDPIHKGIHCPWR